MTVASESACSGTKMKPWEKPWMKRGQARFQKSIVGVTWVMSQRATPWQHAARRASISRWSMRETRRPEIISAISVPTPPGASVRPDDHAS